MTYCAAIRVNDAVHLVGDSAVTSDEANGAPSDLATPFGEPYAPENGRIIQDGAIKLYEIDGDAFAIAGRYTSGIAILRRYKKLRTEGLSKKSCVELAVIGLAPISDVTILAVIRHDNSLQILRGTPKAEPEIVAIDDFCSIGANETTREIFNQRLLAVKEEFETKVSPTAFLALLTATGIASSIQHATFRNGVGGAFNGIAVQPQQTLWQEDHLVMLHDAKVENFSGITIVNRDGWFLTRYKIGEKAVGGKSLVTPLEDDTAGQALVDLERERTRILRDSIYPIRTGKFRFVSFISRESGHVHTVDMQRKPQQKLLQIIPPDNYAGIVAYNLRVSPQLRDRILDTGNAGRTHFESYLP